MALNSCLGRRNVVPTSPHDHCFGERSSQSHLVPIRARIRRDIFREKAPFILASISSSARVRIRVYVLLTARPS